MNTWLAKDIMGRVAMYTHLKARVDVRAIHQRETTVNRP